MPLSSEPPWPPPHDPAGLLRHCLEESAGVDETRFMPEPAGPEGGATGSVLGDFELLGVLGRGGMGTVWRAWQRSLRREVAVKVLGAGLSEQPGFVESFKREAELAASLRHPAIVPVYAVGEEDGVWFYAMELVDGVTLADVLKERGALSPAEAARQVLGAAEGLAHAHARGVWHRDVKPSNLLIEPGGALRVTDFGLARVAATGPTGTTVAALGTPSYVAPEQARGRTASPAVDVYGLGAVLYHALTGRPPFTGETALQVLDQVAKTLPVAPRRLHPGVAPDLETICLRCLEKEPGRRYADAAALADDLRAFLEHRPVKARPVSWAGHTWRWMKREPVQAALAVTALAAALAALWLAQTSRRLNHATAALQATQRAAEYERQLSVLQNAAAYLHDGNVRQAGQLLDTMGEPERASWGFLAHYLAAQCADRQDHAEPQAHAHKIWKVEAAPSGRLVASTSEDGHVTLWDTASRQVRLRAAFPGSLPWGLWWKDDDHLLVTAFDGGARWLEVATGCWSEPVAAFADLRELQVSHDRKYAVGVASVGFFWQIQQPVNVVNLEENRVVWQSPQDGNKAALSPDGRFVVIVPGSRMEEGKRINPEGWLSVWDWRVNREVGRLDYSGAGSVELGRCVAWAPDGRSLAAGIGPVLLKWSVPETWPETMEPQAPDARCEVQGAFWQVKFVNDGRHLLASSSDQQVRVLDAAELRVNARLRGHANEVWSVELARPAATAATPAQIVSGDKDGTLCWWAWPPPFDPDFFPQGAYGPPIFGPDQQVLIPPRAPGRNDHGSLVNLRTGLETSARLPGLGYGWDVARSALLMVDWQAARFLWMEPESGRLVHELPLTAPPGEMRSRIFGLSPDSHLCWEWTPQALHVRRTDDGAVVYTMEETSAEPAAIAISADNRWLALASRRDPAFARLADLSTGVWHRLPHKSDGVTSVVFSPDARFAVTGGEDGQVRVWRLPVEKVPATLETILPGILESVSALAFSPDGTFLVSGEPGGRLRFWHTPTWRETAVLRGPPGCQFLAFSPDGEWLATTTGFNVIDGVRLLHAPTR